MEGKPLVSIIVNCYNGENFLEDCITSIKNQTYKNWEVIFWDNFSTDKSKDIIIKFKDPRIKYFKAKKFTSLYEARNLAIEHSSGKYISFLDTDDIWTKDKISKQLDFFNTNKEFDIVYSNYYLLQKNNLKIQFKKKLPVGEITQKLINYYSIGVITVMLKRKIFENYKFNKEFNIIGDFDFFINISKNFKIGCIQEPLAAYRIHKKNYSLLNLKEHVDELETWLKNNKNSKFILYRQRMNLIKLKLKLILQKIL